MTLALATRGYLCRGSRVCPPFGPGPTITGIVELQPTIGGSAHVRDAGPTISGAGVPAPSIDASSSPTSPAAGDSPTITGAGDQKPDINKSES